MPKVFDLPTVTDMDDADFFLMEESTGGTKKINKSNAVNKFLSFYPVGIASLSDLNTAVTNGSSALYFSADVAVGGVTIPRYSRGMSINPHGSPDGVIMVVDSARNFYTGFRNGSTWNVRTNKQTSTRGVVTRTSGATLTSSTIYTCDKIASVMITFTTDQAYTAGNNVFEGTITSSTYYPVVNALGLGYVGNAAVILNYQSTGNVICRVVGGTVPSGANLGVQATFILA